MEIIVLGVIAYIAYRFISKGSGSVAKKSGGCKYCGGSLDREPRKGYSYACSGCGTDFP